MLTNICLYCTCAVPKKIESSLSCVSINFSVSLDNTKIAQIIVMVEEWHHPVKQVAKHFGITSARVYQLRAYYRKHGEYPLLKKRGRKSRVISEQLRQDIIGLKLDLNLGSSGIPAYLRSVRGIKIGPSSVHRVLLEEELTEKDPSKSVRRCP